MREVLRNAVAVVLGTVLLASGAAAQVAGEADMEEPPVGEGLSLREAVNRALATSEEVRTAQARRALAESQVVQARSGALPQVNANVSYNRTLASIFDDFSFSMPGDSLQPPPDEFEDGELFLPFGQRNTWVASLSVSQPIYSGGRLSTGLDIARHVRRAAELELQEARADIALQVRNAYFQAVLASELVGISEEAFALADEQVQQVELFFSQGTASEFDVLNARVERDNLEPTIVEARNSRRVAELNLKRLINIPADEPLVLTTPLEPLVGEVDRARLEAAISRRPALEALDEVVASRAGAVRIARAGRLPTVGANANFSYQAFPLSIAPIDADWRRDWSLGFQVSIPIFNGFRTRGEIQQARAELATAELQRDQFAESLEMELEAALGELNAARSQIEARRATVEQARRALDLATLRFQTGLTTQLEISNARLLLEQARVNEVQALFNYLTALARLERVTGGEVPLVGQSLP